MKINAEQTNGEKSLKGLIEQTKPKVKPQYKIIEEEVLKEIFQ